MSKPGPRQSTKDSVDLAAMAGTLAAIALRASDMVLRAYESGVPIRAKADSSPVCEADERSEEIILAALAEHFPGVPAVSEEAVSQGLIPKFGNEFFLVDPLDGTREFAARNGEFTVTLAFIRNGAPICGAVCAPVARRLWTGWDAQAWEHVVTFRDGEAELTGRRPAIISHDSSSPLRVLISRSHLEPATEAFLATLPPSKPVRIGSSVKFCLIASGEGDVYPRFGPTMEWDTAAGDAVLRAAGGIVVDANGHPMRYGKAAEGFHNPHFVAWADPAQARIVR